MTARPTSATILPGARPVRTVRVGAIVFHPDRAKGFINNHGPVSPSFSPRGRAIIASAGLVVLSLAFVAVLAVITAEPTAAYTYTDSQGYDHTVTRTYVPIGLIIFGGLAVLRWIGRKLS